MLLSDAASAVPEALELSAAAEPFLPDPEELFMETTFPEDAFLELRKLLHPRIPKISKSNTKTAPPIPPIM